MWPNSIVTSNFYSNYYSVFTFVFLILKLDKRAFSQFLNLIQGIDLMLFVHVDSLLWNWGNL